LKTFVKGLEGKRNKVELVLKRKFMATLNMG